jgi:hypothetical protein
VIVDVPSLAQPALGTEKLEGLEARTITRRAAVSCPALGKPVRT